MPRSIKVSSQTAAHRYNAPARSHHIDRTRGDDDEQMHRLRRLVISLFIIHLCVFTSFDLMRSLANLRDTSLIHQRMRTAMQVPRSHCHSYTRSHNHRKTDFDALTRYALLVLDLGW